MIRDETYDNAAGTRGIAKGLRPFLASKDVVVIDKKSVNPRARSHFSSAIAATSFLLEWLTNRTGIHPPRQQRGPID
jgi:hypothetical protein